MSRLEKIAQICIIVTAPLVILAVFPHLEPIQKIAPQVSSDKALLLASFFAVYAAILAAIAVIVALSWQLASRLYFTGSKSELTAQMLAKSVPVTGGVLFIEGEFSGRFMNGYLAANFSTSAGRERVYWKYNEAEDLGEIHGDRLKEPFVIKWNIPSSETAEGECKVRVELYDVHVAEMLKVSKTRRLVSSWETTVSLSRPKQRGVEIQRMMRPPVDGLRRFDTSSLPMAGWVCIKVYNDSDAEYKDCFGRVNTDAGVFPLCDYGKVAAKGANGSKPTLFSIQPNSSTLLCSNIISRTPKGKIVIDLGKAEISKELDIELTD